MNYADLTDEELSAALAEASGTPPLFRRHDMRALQAERERRALKPPSSRSMPENVESDLAAAAAPLTPDPAVKPKATAAPKPEWDSLDTASGEAAQVWRALLAQGYNYDESMRIMAERSPAYKTMLAESPSRSQRFDARMEDLDSNLADAYGHNDPAPMGTNFTRDGNGSAYGALTDFGGGQTAMVDGVSVPVFDLGDGQQRYRLGDVKRAQEAARDAEWLAGHRKMVEEDIAKYGHYSLRDGDSRLTPEQSAARVARKNAEVRAAEARAERRQFQIKNAARPLTPFEQEEKRRRQLRADMARLAGGSQNLNSGNNSFFQALAMLEGVRPEAMDAQQRAMMQMMPMDPNRAQVEARQLDAAARLAGEAITGALAGQGTNTAQQEVLRGKRAGDGKAWFDSYYDTNFGWTPYDEDSYRRAVDYLINVHNLDRPTAEAIAQSRGLPRSRVSGPAAVPPRTPGVPQPPGVTAGGNPMPATDGFDR